jgi:hypothetical protein
MNKRGQNLIPCIESFQVSSASNGFTPEALNYGSHLHVTPSFWQQKIGKSFDPSTRFARSLLKDDATLTGILLFSGLRPVAVL